MHKGRLELVIRKNFFTGSVLKGLPGEVVDSPSPEVYERCMALRDMLPGQFVLFGG